MNRRSLTAVVSSLLLLGTLIPAASAQDPQVDRQLPEALADLKLDTPSNVEGAPRFATLGRSLLDARGEKSVVVRLATAPSAAVAANGAAAQRGQLQRVKAEQKGLLDRARKLDTGIKVLGSAQKAINAVMVTMDADAIRELSADPSVVSVRPIIDYQLDLSETVPYIGGTAVHARGFDGTGVRVAVLDSGIDYTHVAFGGAGTAAAYTAAYGTTVGDARNTTLDGLFPTAKVIGGFDFVGEAWPTGPLAPDPDPIDCGNPPIPAPCAGGHGTHVADIIAGEDGVAPEAKLYALKVCSAVATSCSGVALIQAMDFAVDPNGDGSTADRVDIVNMSLGASYGQAGDDDLSFAVDMASTVGVLTVASAGNSGDKPYASGTPAAAKTALSVAQTAVPSSLGFVMLLSTDGGVTFSPREAVFQSWSHELDFSVTNVPVRYGDGAGGNRNGCAPFAPGSLTGMVVLVDRGICEFSLKIANIAAGGGRIGVIGLVAPGDPFDGGLGACPDDLCAAIPGYMVSQATSTAMKGPNARVTFDPANGIPLIGHIVGSSSRGPSMVDNRVKPEIGAPGASVSALAGSGTGTESFGGTSGAAPMVSGAAALLQEAFPSRSPAEIKSVLMNTADTDIMNRPEVFGGRLAPITRIGGGEVRVDRALDSKIAAWDTQLQTGALSFGFVDASKSSTLSRNVTIRNYSNQVLRFAISSTFRFAEDATGAVEISAPRQIAVPPRRTITFPVKLRINASRLAAWNLDSGALGASGDALTAMEFDGYIWLNQIGTSADDANPAHLAWQVLPRKSGDVVASDNTVEIDTTAFGFPAGTTSLKNNGAGIAPVDAYSLIATSPNDPDTGPGDVIADVDLRAVGVQTFPVPAGFCSANPSFVLALVANTWDRQSHANAPALFEFDIDVDQDGDFEYAVFNFDLSLSGALADGRNVAWVLNLTTGAASAFFFTDHGTNSTNTVLLLCGEQIGMNATNFGDPMDVDVFAVDWYNSGLVTDFVGDLTISPLGERYFGVFGAGEALSTDIAPGASTTLTVLDFGAAGTNPTESGLILLTDAARAGWRGGAPLNREALLIEVVPD